ncbi:amidohydrolase [Jannaschia aquimarina]|uniref:YxeP_2 protein n=1 Tax=Jannaschia aquimarina TaxID=935700 RepID=A0A0D1EGC4_9RHOB|nr:amidohydrolase [Jannaschia aquimarina]KIT15971.1 putative hydrolase YxeP [Jannaschia aquimarina]SNS98986.1 amidohydrolase [Jannaschia aquimarina]
MDRLTPSDIEDLTAFRRALHAAPEVSGQEVETAACIADALRSLGARVVTGLGGHGVAGVFGTGDETVMLRCELDALPIQEKGASSHRSRTDGVAHLCGHDGHMATMIGVARLLARRPPSVGRVVLLFQPAEEIGTGAIAVCEDPAFADLAPDWAFALHNLPEIPTGEAHIPDGPSSAASVGLCIELGGTEAHAAAPETGRSPAGEIAALMTALPALSRGRFPYPDFRLVTLTHVALGEPAFGIAPGQGRIHVTARTVSDERLLELERNVGNTISSGTADLDVRITEHDRFLAGANDPSAAAHLRRAAEAVGLVVSHGLPLRASEDFGRFGHDCPAAMLFLGCGPGPALHNPDYDFDDDLIAPGAHLLLEAARGIVG